MLPIWRSCGLAKAPLTVVTLVLFLAGCSGVPDAANPVEWYKSAKNVLTGEDAEKPGDSEKPANKLVADRDKPAPGAEESIPSLSTVPPRPRISARVERENISGGLVADRENARRYSSEVIRRQGEVDSPSRRPAVAPAPPPAPVQLVTEPPKVKAKPKPKPQVATVIKKAEAPKLAAPKPTPAPDPLPAPRVAAATSTPAPAPEAKAPPALPAIKIPDETPNAPKLAVVKPYVPPAGVADLGTVIISGSGQRTVGVSSGQRPPPFRSRSVTASGGRPLPSLNRAGTSGSYQVATIQFPNGSAKIGARERKILRQVAAQHKRLGGTIRVVGHASSRTRSADMAKHKMINLRISAARADSIAKELVKLGTKAGDINIGAVSDSEPRFHEYMPSGEAGNRRAEIFIDF